MGKIVIEGEVTCGKLFLCNRYLSVPNGGSTKPQETFVAEWGNPIMNMSALSYY